MWCHIGWFCFVEYNFFCVPLLRLSCLLCTQYFHSHSKTRRTNRDKLDTINASIGFTTALVFCEQFSSKMPHFPHHIFGFELFDRGDPTNKKSTFSHVDRMKCVKRSRVLSFRRPRFGWCVYSDIRCEGDFYCTKYSSCSMHRFLLLLLKILIIIIIAK